METKMEILLVAFVVMIIIMLYFLPATRCSQSQAHGGHRPNESAFRLDVSRLGRGIDLGLHEKTSPAGPSGSAVFIKPAAGKWTS
jgi:hypothetical protein